MYSLSTRRILSWNNFAKQYFENLKTNLFTASNDILAYV